MPEKQETRKLKGGLLLSLVRLPDGKWRIDSLDQYTAFGRFGETVSGPKGTSRASVGELARYDLPEGWAEMRFDSADEAEAFAEGKIAALAE